MDPEPGKAQHDCTPTPALGTNSYSCYHQGSPKQDALDYGKGGYDRGGRLLTPELEEEKEPCGIPSFALPRPPSACTATYQLHWLRSEAREEELMESRST